jgi:hypothetical protein
MTELLTPEESSGESERMALMLENWFQQRTKMTARAFRFLLLPLLPMLTAAALFWYNFYIPVPAMVLAALFMFTVLVWLVCLIIGARVLSRVRTGDSLMLRKIRTRSAQREG